MEEISTFHRLHRAARSGDLETLKSIIDMAEPSDRHHIVEHKDSEPGGFGCTMLLQAAEAGHLDLVKYLVLELQADFYAINELEEQSGAIHLAASRGHFEVVQFLTSSCSALVDFEDACCNTPLLRAAAKGNLRVVKFLLENFQIDLEKRGSRGRTALLLACEARNAQVVRYLVEKGAQIDAEDEYEYDEILNAAHIAAFCDNLETLCYLLTQHPRFIRSKTSAGNTLLHTAIEGGSRSVASFLIKDVGFYVESKGSFGMTPFLFAAWHGELAIMKELVQAGCNVYAQMAHGQSRLYLGNALHLAIRMHHENIVHYLQFEFPSLITIPNRHGETPLDIAEASHRRKMARMVAPPVSC